MKANIPMATNMELAASVTKYLKFLMSDCASYDKGNTDFALSIVTRINKLLSLRKNIAEKVSFDWNVFWDSCVFPNPVPPPPHGGLRTGICNMQFRNDERLVTVFYSPVGEKYSKIVSCDYWWETEPVLIFQDRKHLTRKELLNLVLVYEKGTADVSLYTQFEHVMLNRANPMLDFSGNEKEIQKNMDTAIFASVRQIASEVIKTFEYVILRLQGM